LVDQEEIHNQCLSVDPKERIHALEQLEEFFSLMPDKQQEWNDLLKLTNDEESSVRYRAAAVFHCIFSHIPDEHKQQAWNDFIRLIYDEESSVRYRAATFLYCIFSEIPDKQQEWNDLLKLTNDEDIFVTDSAAKALNSVFSQVPDKQQAWNDLIKLLSDEDGLVRYHASSILSSIFSYIPNEHQALNDLYNLAYDKVGFMKCDVASIIGSVFTRLHDKQKAWSILHELINHRSTDVMNSATSSIGSVFVYLPDRQQAWSDLIKLIEYSNDHIDGWFSDPWEGVVTNATDVLVSVFPHVPDKQQVWNDLIKLIGSGGVDLFTILPIFISVLPYVQNKQQAFNGLHRLANDVNSYARHHASIVLGSTFSFVPNIQQAWEDLHKLTNDEESNVRSAAASAIGSAYSQVSDKQQAWSDLLRLTNDKDDAVRVTSNHSLGRVSIFMASQAETDEDYKKELEKAIKFFETAAKEASYYNPAQFCLPFYRSFHTIIFKKLEAREEVDKYLEEAESAIQGSESKELLFEAVQNLAEALKEVQNIGNLDLSEMKSELNFYRKYCDHAAELMKETDEKAPFATKVLRKGLPILDKNLKELLEEIKEKAKTACKVSQGTTTEEIACAVNREVQKWEIGNQEEMARYVENLIFSLKSKIPNIPENKNIYDRIDSLKNEKDLTRQYEILPILISLIPQIVPEIRGTVKNAGGSMGTRENVSKTYTVGDVHGTVIQGEYIINNSVIITPSPSNSTANKKADVLLVTATKVESKAVLDIFQKNTGKEPHLVPIGDQIYHDIGSVNGNSVVLVQSEMGSGGLGASLLTVQKAITDLSPNEVIMVGIAFGIDPEKHSIGDVLVSKQLMLYELQRVGTKDGNPQIIPRGDKAPASTRLLSYFRNAEISWDESQCKASFGLILSGEKLVDNTDFVKCLRDLEPEAIGGEMEGAGLYVACHDKKVDWIIVKAICDWADGKKSENKEVKQELAAKNAASFVSHALQLVSFNGKLQEHENVSGIESLKINTDKLYNIQKSEKIKDAAKAIDLKFAKFSGPKYQELVKLFKDKSKSTSKFNFINPLYSQNDIDFVVHYDISKLDYNLSSEILQFFEDLSEAENARIYIQNNCKNLDPQIQTLCTLEYQNMKFLVVSCINKVAEIRSQLKKIYEKSE